MNTHSPLVSVVVPTYNAEPFLRQALDSCLSQTYPHLEIICVNDGSKDNSPEIIKEYAGKDFRIKLIDQPNGGYGKAMNAGLKAATGKYFAILEPDDYLPSDAYEKLVSLAEEKELDFIKGSTSSFFTDAQQNAVFSKQPPYPIMNEVICPRKRPDSVIHLAIDSWNGLYNLDFLREHQVEYHESPGASYQDTGFFMQTFTWAERVMFIEDTTYFYRIDNPGSSKNNISSKMYTLFEEYRFIKRKLETDTERWEEMKPLYLERYIGGHRWIYESLRDSLRMEYLRKAREEFMTLEDYDRSQLLPIDIMHFREILISPEYFLLNEAIRNNICNISHNLNHNTDILNTILNTNSRAYFTNCGVVRESFKPLLRRKKRYYGFMACISFGKRKRKYLEKKQKIKALLLEMKG